MKRRTFLQLSPLLASSLLSAHAAITGQWDFKTGDLSGTIGQPLNYLDGDTQVGTKFGTTTSFGIPDIGGQAVKIMQFPATTSPSGGYDVPTGAAGNGGGSFLNEWTVIMDVVHAGGNGFAQCADHLDDSAKRFQQLRDRAFRHRESFLPVAAVAVDRLRQGRVSV